MNEMIFVELNSSFPNKTYMFVSNTAFLSQSVHFYITF